MRRTRPEHEVLLCIARRVLDTNNQTELRHVVQQSLNWDYLFSTAADHGLIPLLHQHLSAIAGDLVPGHFLARLRQESVVNSQSVLLLIGKLLDVHRLFADNAIPVATFKGPLLAQLAYGEISLRQAGDIDLLISRQHFSRAKLLLESLGYQMFPKLTPAQLASHLSFHCEIQFMRDDGFTVIDLHWGLTPRSFVFKLEADDVMSRLQPACLGGSQVQTFCTDDLIVYLAMHGAKHLWRELEWVGCLSEVLRSCEIINWATVIKRAANARGTRMLGLGLRLVEIFYSESAPTAVLDAVDPDHAMKKLAQQVYDQIFIARAGPIDSTDTGLYNLKIMDRKRDAVTSAFRAIFVPTLSDWEALTLPASLHSLYYAFRPLRLSKIYSSLLLRRLSH
jgi:hypothetical protein